MQHKILHVIGSLDNGGSQVMVINLMRKLDHNKYIFDFVIDRRDELFFKDEVDKIGGSIYVCPQFTLKNVINFIRWWVKFLRKHPEYEIIHGHVRSTASIYLLIGKIMGRKTIAHSHSISSGNGISAVVKNILQFPIRYIADYFLACTAEAGCWLFGEQIKEKSNFTIIKNAIDTRGFYYDRAIRSNTRKELRIDSDMCVVGNVARLYAPKNYVYLLKIFKKLNAMERRFCFLIVGDGPEKNELKQIVNEYELDKSVVFLGARKDINEILNAMDFFMMPSLYEGFGMSLIEAQSTGLMCLASNKVPMSTRLTSNVFYEDIDDNSIDKWCDFVVNNINYYREDKSSDVKNKGFDIEQNTEALEKIYTLLINGN